MQSISSQHDSNKPNPNFINNSFDLTKHYNEIAIKYSNFIKDFELEDYINFKKTTGKNHCIKCHYQKNEPLEHQQAKSKLFDIVINASDYLVESELKAVKNKGCLQVFDKGERQYQFDILCIHVNNLQTVFDHCSGVLPVSFNFLKNIEHNIIFALEADGNHSYKKDQLRDKFFFHEYGIITARYEVSDLIDMYKKTRGRIGTPRHMKYYTKEVTEAYHNKLTIDDIIGDVRAYYKKNYKNRYV